MIPKQQRDLVVGIVPFSPTDPWDDAVNLAVPFFRGLEGEHGRGIVVLNTRSRFGGPVDELSASRTVITPRSRSGGRGPVFAYCPFVDALLLAQRVAVGGMIVVAADDAWISGWARQWRAVDLNLNKHVERFTDDQQALLDDLDWNGNNGWPPRDSFVKSRIRRIAVALHESGLTPDDACGAMLARGHSRDSVKRLRPQLL